MSHAKTLVRIATGVVLLASACGYTLVQGGRLFGVDHVAIIPFVEDEPAGVAGELAALTAERLAAHGVRLSRGQSTTRAVLTGHVVSISTVPAPSAGQSIPLYRVNLRLLATLREGDKLLWQTRLALYEDFLSGAPTVVTDQPELDLATEANRREALVRITRRAAEQLCEQIEIASAAALESSDN